MVWRKGVLNACMNPVCAVTGLTMAQSMSDPIVFNLVDNAVKYTPDGGTITLSLEAVEDNAVLRVTDTGTGIPAAELLHVFDRFYRVGKDRSSRTGGSGLGLSICKMIAELHGGTITATSTPGNGSSFTVSLPTSA